MRRIGIGQWSTCGSVYGWSCSPRSCQSSQAARTCVCVHHLHHVHRGHHVHHAHHVHHVHHVHRGHHVCASCASCVCIMCIMYIICIVWHRCASCACIHRVCAGLASAMMYMMCVCRPSKCHDAHDVCVQSIEGQKATGVVVTEGFKGIFLSLSNLSCIRHSVRAWAHQTC